MVFVRDNDERFEQALIASARGDAEPSNTEEAWVRFAGTLRAVAPATAELGDPDTHLPRAARLPDGAVAVARSGRTARALLAGALGAAGVTAALWVARPLLSSRPPDPVTTAQPALEPAVAPPGASEPSAQEPADRRSHAAGTRRSAISRRSTSAGSGQISEPEARSDLAIEVARIETARTTAALGDYDEAVRLVDRYHQEFPRGTLAPDADVVALEATAAQHDAAETARRAALFLARYPNDPHSARVRWLASHAAESRPPGP